MFPNLSLRILRVPQSDPPLIEHPPLKEPTNLGDLENLLIGIIYKYIIKHNPYTTAPYYLYNRRTSQYIYWNYMKLWQHLQKNQTPPEVRYLDPQNRSKTPNLRKPQEVWLDV